MKMTTEQAFQDIESLLTDLGKKQDFDLEEWATKTSEEMRVTDSIKCIECNHERPEREMQKIFQRGEGICKKCWLYGDYDE